MYPYKFVTKDSRGNSTEYPKNLSGDQAKKILSDLAFGGKTLHVWVETRVYGEQHDDTTR